MKEKSFSKDAVLLLIASFFYMSSPMIVTPIITGFTGILGGTGFLMGFVGGLVNLVSLGCRPMAGNLTDKMAIGKTLMLSPPFPPPHTVHDSFPITRRSIEK